MTPVYKHPLALVESETIGEGTHIWAFTHVMKGVSIGSHCNVGEHCFIETGVVIGSYVTIKNGNELWEGVRLADGVFVGPNVSFTNDLWPRSPRLPQAASRYRKRDWLSPTLVQHGASIGAGAIILAGRRIGEFALVGAGAIVTRDVPPYALVVGAPARVVGWVCQCGSGLRFHGTVAVCERCGLQFLREGDVLHARSAPAAAA
jgi:acetyltransferase-like isoleucine patch superfamily enzyme